MFKNVWLKEFVDRDTFKNVWLKAFVDRDTFKNCDSKRLWIETRLRIVTQRICG
jgi:hypothetical protein